MQRRLEDVSHFFLGDAKAAVKGQRPAPSHKEPLPLGRPWTVCIASYGDHTYAAMVVTALAACLARRGRRVLAGQTHEQTFGVIFGLCGRTPVGPSGVLVTSDLGVRLSRVPLVGGRLPGVLVDGELRAQWDACASEADAVVIHVNHDSGILGMDGIPSPDEFVMMVGDAAHESLVRSYQAIKRAVRWNSDVVLRLATADPDVGAEPRWLGVVRAVETFLGRQCVLDSSFRHESALASSFLSGRLCRDGGDQVIRIVESIVNRWDASTSQWPERRELSVAGGPWSGRAAGVSPATDPVH